jgi:hypothetical protein
MDRTGIIRALPAGAVFGNVAGSLAKEQKEEEKEGKERKPGHSLSCVHLPSILLIPTSQGRFPHHRNRYVTLPLDVGSEAKEDVLCTKSIRYKPMQP